MWLFAKSGVAGARHRTGRLVASVKLSAREEVWTAIQSLVCLEPGPHRWGSWISRPHGFCQTNYIEARNPRCIGKYLYSKSSSYPQMENVTNPWAFWLPYIPQRVGVWLEWQIFHISVGLLPYLNTRRSPSPVMYKWYQNSRRLLHVHY